MNETYDVYQDAAGEWRWRLMAANAKIIADSGEGYSRRRDCIRAIKLVMVISQTPLVRVGDPAPIWVKYSRGVM